MRFFIFQLENIYIAISADKIKRFISHNEEESADNNKIRIPVSMIFGTFNQNDKKYFYNDIILKQKSDDNKTLVIITPPVERDIDIAEKEIQVLPEILKGIYSSFYGIYFNEQNIILFLDIDKVSSVWLKNHEHDTEVSL